MRQCLKNWDNEEKKWDAQLISIRHVNNAIIIIQVQDVLFFIPEENYPLTNLFVFSPFPQPWQLYHATPTILYSAVCLIRTTSPDLEQTLHWLGFWPCFHPEKLMNFSPSFQVWYACSNACLLLQDVDALISSLALASASILFIVHNQLVKDAVSGRVV